MDPFLGRRQEINELNALLDKQTASLVAVYGRRRVGKSRLIEEFAKPFKMYSFVGLTPRMNLSTEDQLTEFRRQMQRQISKDIPLFDDWGDALHMLAKYVQKGRVIILLDEITWMANQDPDFLGKLKIAWDTAFKKNPKLIMILCGSVSAWINKNIILNTGFHGRISLKMRIKELPLETCNLFWGTHTDQISAYEKFKFLSVTGGIPKYLEELNTKQSAEDNIRRLCFNESGILFNDFNQIFSDVLMHKTTTYHRITRALAAEKLEYSMLCQKLNVSSGGAMSEYLGELELAGFISRYPTWNIQTGKPGKVSQYTLCDNYLRFYLKYIYPNINLIINGDFLAEFGNKHLSSLRGWNSIMALQFENLVLNNRYEIKKLLNINTSEIICDNPYLQRASKQRKGCQIDYMIQTEFGGLYICEIKFSRNVIGKEVIQEVSDKIKLLDKPKHFSIRPILIHVGAVSDEVHDSGYFSSIIDLAQLLR